MVLQGGRGPAEQPESPGASTVPSSPTARATRSASSSRPACALRASRSNGGWFIKSMAASSLVLASPVCQICRIVQLSSTIIIPAALQGSYNRRQTEEMEADI